MSFLIQRPYNSLPLTSLRPLTPSPSSSPQLATPDRRRNPFTKLLRRHARYHRKKRLVRWPLDLEPFVPLFQRLVEQGEARHALDQVLHTAADDQNGRQTQETHLRKLCRDHLLQKNRTILERLLSKVAMSYIKSLHTSYIKVFPIYVSQCLYMIQGANGSPGGSDINKTY